MFRVLNNLDYWISLKLKECFFTHLSSLTISNKGKRVFLNLAI